ncbi:MAG: xanthine dehydrogenase family protein molybdopterin-binding subunit [Actinomycetes bacterium]
MTGSLLGNAVPRVEDPALLRGRGRYVDDLEVPGALHAVFVRSTVAHGRLHGVDLSEALMAPGVVAAYSAADLAVASYVVFFPIHPDCRRPPLASGKVCFVGDPVAVVIAETRTQALDAAELVVVDLEPLPSVTDMESALAPGAPVQIESMESNLAIGRREGDGAAVLDGADVVVRARIENQRLAAVPMEGNAIAVVPGDDGAGHLVTVYPASQMPHRFRADVAETLGLEPTQVRVVVPDVGGAFGAKGGAGAEHRVVVSAAMRLGRPVKWIESRSENMVAMPHGRGQVQYIEMGFTREGKITGLRCRIVGDGGAYGGFGGMLPSATTRMMATGTYHVPRLAYEVAVALTNTTPMGAYRGAGRPEAAAYLERIMELASLELGIDPLELRRRNFLQPSDFPFTTLTGASYDCGDYQLSLDEAARAADYPALRADQAERRARGDRVQLGIGVAAYVEVTGGGNSSEYGFVEVHPDGTATVRSGTSSHGQGHATSFSMIVADALGIPLERIRYEQSDTALIPTGGGTGGSRSLQLGGSAVSRAADAVLEHGRAVAARLLEAAPEDIVVTADGRLAVAGVPATGLDWGELAAACAADDDPLLAALDFDQGNATFPFGAHIAVVEVDTETGRVELVRHIAVDDCGRIVNPLIVAGQQHGGVAQGAAQALFEQVVYDPDGNPLTATLMDYAIPSAAEFPSFEALNTETPTPRNPLGAKGIGESGSIGSTPAIQNAVVDALAHLGVRHVDMPCTSERVWRAIGDAGAGRLVDPWREPPAVFATLPGPDVSPTPTHDEEIDL